MEIALAVLELLLQYGPYAALFLLIGYLLTVILDEDKSALWRARMYRALHSLSGRRDLEKKYISNDINGRINLARRNLHHGKETLPVAVSVEWVESGQEGTYDIREGEFVVRLDPSSGQERNIAKLAMAVVGRTTLAGIRHLVEKPLQQAVDLNLVRNLLAAVGDRLVLDWFFQNEYRPITSRSDVERWNKEIVEIDQRGLFTRVLLVELEAFSKRISGMEPRPFMSGEIESLVHFLYRIATKEVGQDVPLDLVRAYLSVGVILVARTSKLLDEGIEPYVKAMNHRIGRGHSSVYVIVFDKELLRERDEKGYREFVRRTKELDREILNSSLATKDFSFRYTCVDQRGATRKAICTRYVVASAS